MDSIDIIKDEQEGITTKNGIVSNIYNHFSDTKLLYFHAGVICILCIIIYLNKPLSVVDIKLKKNGYVVKIKYSEYFKLCFKMIILYLTVVTTLLVLKK
jgi:hypothetical protein